jgi:hypothetical protein
MPSCENDASVHCLEFAHVHQYHNRQLSNRVEIKQTKNDSHSDTVEDCHAGILIVQCPAMREVRFDFTLPQVIIEYSPVYKVELFFKSPFLEPNRKPPKIS